MTTMSLIRVGDEVRITQTVDEDGKPYPKGSSMNVYHGMVGKVTSIKDYGRYPIKVLFSPPIRSGAQTQETFRLEELELLEFSPDWEV